MTMEDTNYKRVYPIFLFLNYLRKNLQIGKGEGPWSILHIEGAKTFGGLNILNSKNKVVLYLV